MKLHYHAEDDMLYVRLREGSYAESEEVAPGVVLDFDADGRVIAVEFEDARARTDLARLDVDLGALTFQAGLAA